jgi:hypothetical protein
MSSETESTFARAIEEHLELRRRNSTLDRDMPIDRYRVDDPFENHPLFKTEEQARLEETLDGTEPEMITEGNLVLAWPTEESVPAEDGESSEDSFWGRPRDFDWGD